jgi:hypothetical protein
MGSNSGAVQSSTTKSEPWSALQQPIQDVIGNANTLYAQPYQAYEGQTIAGPSDSTVAGYNLGYQASTLSSPDMLAARGMLTDVSGGNFFGQGPTATNNWLNSTAQGQNIGANPYVQQNSDWTKQVMADNAANMASGFATGGAAQNDAAFARQGAYGGSAYDQKQRMDQAALAQQIGQAGNAYNMQRSALGAQDYQQGVNSAMGAAQQQQGAYGTDMSNMMQAASMAPQFANSDFQAADYLRSMGSQQEGYNQKLLDAQQSSWQQAMNAPYQQMQGYANLLSQFAGTGSTGSTQVYGGGQSPLGLGVGAGLLGLGAYNAFKTP